MALKEEAVADYKLEEKLALEEEYLGVCLAIIRVNSFINCTS